jgi:prepilin-type N-terminal cleavage/methylation domain-containing protein
MPTKGYTLTEFLVVVFIVGLLSALAMPSWLSFYQRQQIRTAASQLHSALQLAKSEGSRNSVRYAVTVCSNFSESQQLDWIKYSIHPYSESPFKFTTIENVSLVKSTVRRSPSRYNLSRLNYGDCYTAYLGLFPGDGYALGFFYLSKKQHKYIYRVGYNTLLGNIMSCSVISLEEAQCQ